MKKRIFAVVREGVGYLEKRSSPGLLPVVLIEESFAAR
jgi:hypothetical protein